jgi:hypothetical protein
LKKKNHCGTIAIDVWLIQRPPMFRSAVLISLAMTISAADAATLLVETRSFASGFTDDGPVGGSDIQSVVTNTAGGDASALLTSAMTIPGGATSGLASGNIATGEMKARIGTNPGTYYGGIDGVGVIGAQGGGVSQVLISETFVASGSGTVRFDLAYDGSWSLGPQPFLSCCDESGPVAGFFDPQWGIEGGLTLGGPGVLSGENFFFAYGSDPDGGSVAGVLTAFATLIDGQEYGISMTLVTAIYFGATGGIDFSNTAVLRFTTDPGLTLAFADDRFLSAMAPVPLPASGLLLLLPLIGLARLRNRRARSLT